MRIEGDLFQDEPKWEAPQPPDDWKWIGAAEWIGTLGAVGYAASRKKKTIHVTSVQGAPVGRLVEEPVVPEPDEVPIAPGEHPNLFAALPCSKTDQKSIAYIVKNLSNKMYLLVFPRLLAIEKEIDHVHPFKFLSTIFGNPLLKSLMPKVFADGEAKKGFMRGVNKGMKRETAKKNIDPYIDDFARAVQVVPAAIKPLIQDGARQNNWIALVEHLIASNGVREG